MIFSCRLESDSTDALLLIVNPWWRRAKLYGLSEQRHNSENETRHIVVSGEKNMVFRSRVGTLQRVQPSQNLLDQMLRKHLSFEINRFRIAASMWGKPKYGSVVDAMIRESCLIHMRLLLDFFYPRIDPAKKRKFEDVFVTDYLPENTQLRKEFQDLLAEPPWLQEYRNQLDWRLAHLTMKRIDFERNPVWQPEKQFAHLERLICEFLSALPEKTRALFGPHQQ